MASVLTLAEAKQHLQFRDPNAASSDDFELQDFIDAAESRLSLEVGPLQPTTFVEYHTSKWPLYLRQRPVVSITSIVEGSATLSPSSYTLQGQTVSRTFTFESLRPVTVTVTYVAGYSTLPAHLLQATKELVRHLWATQRGTSGAAGARAEMLGGAAPEAGLVGSGHALPTRVLELIDFERRSNLLSGFA